MIARLEQLPHVAAHVEMQIGVHAPERGDDDLGEEPLAGRHHVESADAGEVGLHEPQGVAPHRAGEIDQGIEAAEDGVVRVLARAPAFPEPPFLRIGQAENVPHGGVAEIEGGQPLDGLLQDQGDGVDVRELRRQDGEGTGEDANRVEHAVVEVDDVPGSGAFSQALDEPRNGGLRQAVERVLHLARQRQAGQSLLLGDGQHSLCYGHHACRQGLRRAARAGP